MPKKQPTAAPDDAPSKVDDSLVQFDFGGSTFTIPKDRGDWSTEATAWLAERKFNLFAKYLLERTRNGQWAAVCKLCPTQRNFTEFFVALGTAIEQKCTGE